MRHRIRAHDLPHGTYVRNAVVLVDDGAPGTDAAARIAVREAQRRDVPLIVVAFYRVPVDPDLESIMTPEILLREQARGRAEANLVRAVGLPVSALPAHEIVTERGSPLRVLLSDYDDALLIVVPMPRHGLAARLWPGHTLGARLAQRSHVPVRQVPVE